MEKSIVFTLIKTSCGRKKYSELSDKKGLINRIRLFWFILIASIRDLNLPNPDKTKN